jgi:tRNA pseudouridine38-40 synthase
VNFQSASQIPVERWCVAMNSRLPGDIVVWDASEVPESFHARRSAKTKTYRYTIRCGKHADPMRRRFEFHHYSPLDIEAMQHGLNYLLGQHEFTTFCSVRTASLSHVRTIFEAKLIADPVDEVLKSYALHLYVTGNGFLYNMVRIITGTILEVGQGRRSVESIGEILKAKNRAFAGPTAVPQGLMLWNVEY